MRHRNESYTCFGRLCDQVHSKCI